MSQPYTFPIFWYNFTQSMERNLLGKAFTKVEEKLLGGSNWATESMTAKQRLQFYSNTGLWPGPHNKASTKMFIESDINSAVEVGQLECAEIKRKRAREAGLIE
jgi:hypothetical protein